MTIEHSTANLEEVISALIQHRDDADRYIKWLESLLVDPLDAEAQILLHMITQLQPTFNAVAQWANEQGLRMPTSKPKGRLFKMEDIKELSEHPRNGWTPELIFLCRRCYWSQESVPGRGSCR